MVKSRAYHAKLNILISLFGQIITLICGIITPRLLLGAFGSEAYGATASIAQFLAYITLLEGGIGGVARAALYRPLAIKDSDAVSRILDEIKSYFRIIGIIFIIYVLVLGSCFKFISHFEYYDWFSSFLLVIAISISTFAQYFIGISYSVLLQAAQRTYISSLINSIALIINTVMVIILIHFGFDLIFVKFITSLVFVCRPIAMLFYVKARFSLPRVKRKKGEVLLKQKWDGLGQHIAFFLHSNTDIAVLTLFGNLKLVAVYSVYNMVTAAIQNISISFTSGMESVFGDMLAKKEIKELHSTFNYYETLVSIVSVVLFSVTMVMIIPFVRLYTNGITDYNYYEPVFALLLVFACLLYCLRTPYHSLIIASGCFRETQYAAYGEAILNIALSLILVHYFEIVGVVIGTLVAVIYRFVYYVIYLSNHIFNRPIKVFLRRSFVNLIVMSLSCISSYWIINEFSINNYFSWINMAIIATLLSLLLSLLFNYLFYKREVFGLLNVIKNRI